ncbi:MAG: gamma-glutamyltransferase [Chloroflexi bacterium]|nr:gamma-glutamyltransferase [Chloroflexota bacterium]
MARQQAVHDLEQGDINLPGTGRPVVRSTKGVISSGHYLTSMAGMRMLMNGGNAFDAIAAAGFAAAVIEPIASYSLAAEGVFMLYDAASGDLLSLSGQGVAPAQATAEFYKSRGLDRIPTGPGGQAHLSFTVPGIVGAFISLLDRYGSMPIGQVLAPAIEYAENGIPNYEYMLERLKSPATHQQFNQYPPGGWDVFFDDKQVPLPGSLLVQPGLANTLKAMASAAGNGSGDRKAGLRAARDVFYKGSVAKTIVESSARVGGILSMDDLANYQSQFGEPVSTTFAGHEILGHDTWTQGPMLQQTLNILENFDLKAMGHNSPEYIHTVTESLKLAFGDREAFYADPGFAEVPIDGLLSKEYAKERAGLVDPERAYPEQPAPGDPWTFSKGNGVVPKTSPVAASASGAADSSSHEGTTHVSVLDDRGNMVCGTISGGAFAKSVFFPELGCTLSTRIEMFNCEEGHPNVVEPGKRPRTTLINYIVRKDGHPVMTIGCPGGDNQAQADVQLMLNVLVFGMDPQQAIEAPRFASQSVVNSFYPHTYLPGRLDLEPGVPKSTAEALRARGHDIDRAANCGLGATVSVRDPKTGHLSTGGDPRRTCYAMGL